MSKFDKGKTRRANAFRESSLLIHSKRISKFHLLIKKTKAKASERRTLVLESNNNNENYDFNALNTQKVELGYPICQRQRIAQKASKPSGSPYSEEEHCKYSEEEAISRTEEVIIEDIISLASKESSFSSHQISPALPSTEKGSELDLDFSLKLSEDYNIQLEMSYPSHLTQKMRAILVDWMMEVCRDLKFMRETFYCSVDYLDRTIIKSEGQGFSKENLQLLGLTCLLIAAKKEEKIIPSIETFEYLTEKTFTAKEICEWEFKVLQILSFFINPVTVNYWTSFIFDAWKKHLQHYPPQYKALQTIHAHTVTILDFSKIDSESLYFQPMKLSLAALQLAIEAKMNWAICEFSMFCRKFYLTGFFCLEAEKQYLIRFQNLIRQDSILNSEIDIEKIPYSLVNHLQFHSKSYLSHFI